MTVRDNVIELRKIRHADTLVERIIHGAAAEIERLREEAERLRAERDEARRRVCEDAIRNGRVYRRVGSDTVRCETSKEVAEMMGWDCYKENKENTND